jgi:hypothetical protein
MTDDPAMPTESSPVVTEPPAPPAPPDPPAQPAASAPPPRPEPVPDRRGGASSVAPLVVSVVVLVGAIFLYWQSQNSAAQVAARLDTLESRVQAVEQRPLPQPPPDLGPLTQQVATLDQRLTTLEHRPPPVATLDQGGRDEIAALAGRVDQVTARQNQLGVQQQNDAAQIGTQLSSLNTQLTTATANSGETTGQIAALAARQARTARLQEAATALAAGHPLGTIPDAPAALARFATAAPPTEASLRLSFDSAAAAAAKAGLPIPADAPFLKRVWARVQESVTVRQGSRVLVGDPISGVLQQSRQRLDAGDVAGAVKALDPLVGAAAAAMAPWRQQAQSLVDARAALLAMAQG